MTLTVASWNVNSIKARLPNVLDWLKEAKPDVVCLQEIKTVDENFKIDHSANPWAKHFEEDMKRLSELEKRNPGAIAVLKQYGVKPIDAASLTYSSVSTADARERMSTLAPRSITSCTTSVAPAAAALCSAL